METFLTLKSESKKIESYIAYYYFHVSDDAAFKKSYVFYPNYQNAITIYKDSDVILTEKGSSISPSDNSRIETLYTTNIDDGMKVFLKGNFNKIGIVFKPLGLNYFLDKSLSEIVKGRSALFHYFGKDFENVCKTAFETIDFNCKIKIFDAFFENKLRRFENPILQYAVDEIIASNGMVKVATLAEMLSINRKSLLRLFQKHLICSVEAYKKLVKFRHAYNFSQQENNSLTEVALSGQYYDQADFINHFKSITNELPSKVIPEVSKLGSEAIYWKFFSE